MVNDFSKFFLDFEIDAYFTEEILKIKKYIKESNKKITHITI